MSLSSAINIAKFALRNTSRQTSTVSCNIVDTSNPDYLRHTALLANVDPVARLVEI